MSSRARARKQYVAKETLTGSLPKENKELQQYYNAIVPRLLYGIINGGRRHLGYYDSNQSWPIPISRALTRMEDELYGALNLQSGKVLDAGSGSGQVALHLAQKSSRLEIIAIDAVSKHVKRARRRIYRKQLGDRVVADWGDYHELSRFDEESFDGLYTMESLVHSTQPERALQEFFRVLKPGGHVAHFEYDHVSPSDVCKDDRESMQLLDKYAAMAAMKQFENGGLEQLLRDVGFVDVQARDISEHVEPMVWLWYIVLYVPYFIIVYLGLQTWAPNLVNAVEFYERVKAGTYRYNVVTAQKPGKLCGTSVVRQRSR